MHDLLWRIAFHLADPASPAVDTAGGGDSHVIATTLIIVGGSVVTGAIGLVIASVQRERSPNSTAAAVAANHQRITDQLNEMIDDLQSDKQGLTAERDTLRSKLSLLKKACRRRGLDPDELMQNEAAL